MTIQEFFELYIGCRATDGNIEGIVCGYCSDNIIMKSKSGWSEDSLPDDAYIHNKQPGDRYWNIERSMVDKSSKPNDKVLLNKPIKTNDAEIYIKEHFPEITDDEKDIYINIFMEGTKYITNDTK